MDFREAIWISVIGGHNVGGKVISNARRVGQLLAQTGAVVVCGGLGGVMKAVAEGAKNAGGTTVGILPSQNRNDANPHIDISIPTGLGIARNLLVVRAGDAIIAIGGAWGTLSEIAFAKNLNKTVIGLHSFQLDGITQADTPEEAVDKAIVAAARRREVKDG